MEMIMQIHRMITERCKGGKSKTQKLGQQHDFIIVNFN